MRITILGLAVAALAGCAHSGPTSEGDQTMPEPIPPTAEEAAAASYHRIVEEANHLLFGDQLGYRAGATGFERLHAACKGALCSVGFLRFIDPGHFGLGGFEFVLLPRRNGVRAVAQQADTTWTDSRIYGGWMDHSFFASQANLLVNEDDPDYGAILVKSYAAGNASGQVPTGNARWEGFMAGRDGGVLDDHGSVVIGTARIDVTITDTGASADVRFTEIENQQSGRTYADMQWGALAITSSGFSRERAGTDRIAGQFYGPEQEEVGGVFERDGINGAFGGRRQ